jgi:transposase
MAARQARQRRRTYTREFKEEAVKLVVESGLSKAKAARDLGVPESVLGRWVQRAEEQQQVGALGAAERAELKRLRQEVATLRKERDILKKAAAFFAMETL